MQSVRFLMNFLIISYESSHPDFTYKKGLFAILDAKRVFIHMKHTNICMLSIGNPMRNSLKYSNIIQ